MAVIGVSFTSPDTAVRGDRQRHDGDLRGPPERERRRHLDECDRRSAQSLPDRHLLRSARQPERLADLLRIRQPARLSIDGRRADLERRFGNLPDLPVQSVAVDPVSSDWVYVGTDLGVYRTLDGGATWMDMNSGLPTAMVLDVVIKPDDRLVRAATFGNGVWEMALAAPAGVGETVAAAGGFELGAPRPNPFSDRTVIPYSLSRSGSIELTIFDAVGRRVRLLVQRDEGRGFGGGDLGRPGRRGASGRPRNLLREADGGGEDALGQDHARRVDAVPLVTALELLRPDGRPPGPVRADRRAAQSTSRIDRSATRMPAKISGSRRSALTRQRKWITPRAAAA